MISRDTIKEQLRVVSPYVAPLILYIIVPVFAVFFFNLWDISPFVVAALLAIPILLIGSYNATIRRRISLLVVNPNTGIYRLLLFFRARILISSVVAIWTSISILYWLYYALNFRDLMLACMILSLILLFFFNIAFDRFFKTLFNEIAPTYYRLRTCTLLASTLSVLAFCFFIFVDSSPPPIFGSFFAAVDNQPRYSGQNRTLKAVFDYMAYATAASDYGASVVRRAYDGEVVRLLVLFLVSFPTIYGITLGSSAFLVPCDEYRVVVTKQSVFRLASDDTERVTDGGKGGRRSLAPLFLWLILIPD